MPKKVYVTRLIPDDGVKLLRSKGYEVDVNPKDQSLSKSQLLKVLKKKAYDAVLCLLTDTIDEDIFAAAPSVKIFANYAVGFNNIDVALAKKRGVAVTNTPGVLTEAVAEHTMALILSATCRIVESDNYLRKGKYKEWGPMLFLGTELKGKTLGILGAGRIGSRVAEMARAFNMPVVYYDVKQDSDFEMASGARFLPTVEEVLRNADVVSVHVPLLDSTRHLVNAERLAMMKKDSYLINTSRGAVVDEQALVEALKKGLIRGAALDVFENEPRLAAGLAKLPNVVLTPHIASATDTARQAMSRLAAENIIANFQGRTPPNLVS